MLNYEPNHVMLESKTPKFEKARNCTTDVPTWLSVNFDFFLMAQLVPYGKHKAKGEPGTVPPRELG